MSGFQSPNHTQVPNDLFDVLLSLKGNDKMSEAELRVTLVLIRATLGFHRPQKRMSIRNLARAAGLSASNAYRGAREAVARGTFRELHDGGISQWEIIWTVPVAGTGVPVAGTVEAKSVPVAGTPSIKERRERKKGESTDSPSTVPSPQKPPPTLPTTREIQAAYQEVVGYPVDWKSGYAKAAKWLAQNGYSAADVIACYQHLKADPFWRDKPIHLSSIVKQIGEFMKAHPRAPDPSDGEYGYTPRGKLVKLQ